jgi:toxin ParE1/3/4
LIIVYAPKARAQLDALYLYIARQNSDAVALKFTSDIAAHCRGLATFPYRGRSREDLRPGLRTSVFSRRVMITYDIAEDRLTILGVFYGGQDFEARFEDPETEA